VITERLEDVWQRIHRAGGEDRNITIVAVTKGFGFETVKEAYEAGLRNFGENYAQSLLEKAERMAQEPAMELSWHFIGAIQRRKVAKLASHIRLWHSVARQVEGREVARRCPGASVLVQVNVTGEERRNGCSWAEAPDVVERLLAEGLDVRGLMCMAPMESPRRYFSRLAKLAAELGLHELSMGMSEDFEVAVAEGATMLRLGTVLFGPRPEPGDLRR
jgi:pyridoxal phosphate enzyme (YggS family)